MTDAQITAALNAFDLRGASFSRPQSGYRNVSYSVKLNGREYNLLAYKSELGIIERIKRTNYIGMGLYERGLPVRYPLDSRILRMQTGATRYALLYNYLPGDTISWEAYTKKHIKLIGWAMGRLHKELNMLKADNFPVLYDEYIAILKNIHNYFAQASVSDAVAKKLGLSLNFGAIKDVQSFVFACKDLPTRQIMHMDLVRGNVLFGVAKNDNIFKINDLALTGIIDFEKAALGHPLFDIARTLSFMLVDCSTKNMTQIRNYFINSGYIKRGKNSIKSETVTIENDRKLDVLDTAIKMFWLYDFYKFLRFNPYESLAANYHYNRTRKFLLKYGVIKLA